MLQINCYTTVKLKQGGKLSFEAGNIQTDTILVQQEAMKY